MNKKAALFHWVLLVIIGALALFVFLIQGQIFTEERGEWQLDFVQLSQQSEMDLLYLDNLANAAGSKLIVDYALTAGQFNDTLCGKFQDYNLWNLKEEYCVPIFYEEFNLTLNKSLMELKEELDLEDYIFYNDSILTADYSVKFVNDKFVGISNQEVSYNDGEGNYYSVKPAFSIDLNYSFSEEYYALWQQASSLLVNCRNIEELESCLQTNRESNWYFTLCNSNTETFLEDQRKVAFCVQSPNGKSVYDYRKKASSIIEYKIALDFTPLKPFTIEDIEVYYDLDSNVYEINFESKDLHEEANVYYFIWITDDSSAEDYAGNAYNFENLYHVSTNYLEKIELSALDVVEECPSSKSVGTAYLCSEEGVNMISYVIDATYLDPADYYFTVTLEQAGEESDIAKFVVVS